MADEILILAKRPVDIVETVTEGIGLKPLADNVFKPIGNAIQNIGNHVSRDPIPKEFLKKIIWLKLLY